MKIVSKNDEERVREKTKLFELFQVIEQKMRHFLFFEVK